MTDKSGIEKIIESLSELKLESVSDKPFKLSTEEIINLLELDCGKRKDIESLLYENINIDADSDLGIEFVEINLADLVGMNRAERNSNWLDCLFKLHKHTCYKFYESREKFQLLMSSYTEDNDEIPRVIELNDKYYIHENGKHRLTIAKCLKLAKASVLVSKAKVNS